MWLYSCGILSLWQDLEELIIWQEVESRERVPLSLQVLTQTLLYLIQELVAVLQVLKFAGFRAQLDYLICKNYFFLVLKTSKKTRMSNNFLIVQSKMTI